MRESFGSGGLAWGPGAHVPDTAKTLLRVRTPSHWLSRYALTCLIVAGATLLRRLADPLIHDQIPYFIYVASVVVTTWFCGFGAGLLGTVLAAFIGNYFFVPPRYEFIPHSEDWNAMAMFARRWPSAWSGS